MSRGDPPVFASKPHAPDIGWQREPLQGCESVVGGIAGAQFCCYYLALAPSRLCTAAALLHALLTEFIEFEAAKPVRAAGKRSLEPTLIGLNHLSDCGGTPLTLSPTFQEFHPEIRRRRAEAAIELRTESGASELLVLTGSLHKVIMPSYLWHAENPGREEEDDDDEEEDFDHELPEHASDDRRDSLSATSLRVRPPESTSAETDVSPRKKVPSPWPPWPPIMKRLHQRISSNLRLDQ